MSSLQSALTRNPNSPEISNFLSTRSGCQMVQLMQSMRDPSAQAALTTALLFAPPVLPSRNAVSVKSPERAKKALNAFVGFRCYYIVIPVFKPWPMKKLSGPMGILWDCDPNQSLWSLMTKAWSILRDQLGKDKAPLDQFLGLVCPYLNIPSPEEYLQRLGWEFYIDQNDAPAISRDPSRLPYSSDVGAQTAALSVEDIIGYCQALGYATQYVPDQDLASSTFVGHTARLVAKKQRRAKRQLARDNGVAIRKNPPRPMNCWMLYRDTRHRELKDANPDISVQDISTICSSDWKKLSAAQKDQWRAKANAAKKEHQRMYPDYKYSPRKPGQKKKRQSRKSTLASSSKATTTMTLTPMFDFNASPDSTSVAPCNDQMTGANASATSVNVAPHSSAIAFSRQETLTSQFGFDDLQIEFDNMMDAYGFRNGADTAATLAPFFDPELGLY